MSGWLPGTRAGRIGMCNDRPGVPAAGGKAFIRNIPRSRIIKLKTVRTNAQSALTAARNEMSRTRIINAQCGSAFITMLRVMRETFDFHGHSGKTVYFCIRYANSKEEAGPWGPQAFFGLDHKQGENYE